MKPSNLLLRCYIDKYEDQWQGFCIDLSLAVQGDSYKEVEMKLKAQIYDYIEIALNKDQEYSHELLNRKAPISQRLTYYRYKVLHHIGIFRDSFHRSFKQPMNLMPVPIKK